MIYPFRCKYCNKTVKKTKSRKNTKAHKKGKCSNKCDGIKKDLGGYPVDPFLRAKYISAKRMQRQATMQLRNLMNDSCFYSSSEWRAVRYEALKKSNRRCAVCNLGPPRVTLHVDHIIPISKDPSRKLDITNLQVLCADCNLGKGNRDSINWRGAIV